MASSGMYTNLNGEFRRAPLNTLKIGCIATSGGPMYTNKVLGDDRLQNQEWIAENGFHSFAGYPLIFREELLGVVAMFSRRVMPVHVFERLAVFANQAAIAIKNAQLFTEVKHLKDRLQTENTYLQKEIKLEHNFDEIISRSETMKSVLRKVEQVTSTASTVLILGETGTGKELLARAVHNLSARRDRPLVKVNCAALSANLIESELFGHEKGAFTGALARKIGRFELANGGTIFLDEIGDLPLESQAKLLRVLQEGEFERVGGSQTIKVDVRVIAATNRHLEDAIESDGFREDLYYRLNVFPVQIPPLRERKDDIPLLVRHFAHKHAIKSRKKIESIPQKVLNSFQAYQWPGNIRELENVIERAVILAHDTTLYVNELLEHSPINDSRAPTSSGTLRDIECSHILRTLKECNWQIGGKGGAAERLGLPPSTLRDRIRKLGIEKPKQIV